MPEDSTVENDDRLLNDHQAALYLGCSPRTVRRWRRRGLLPTVIDPGGRYRFRAGSIRQLIRDGEGWLR